MRLAQLARKVNITPTEVKRFIENEFEVAIENDPNLKLEDLHINAVLAHYKVEESVLEEEKEVEAIVGIENTDVVVDSTMTAQTDSSNELKEDIDEVIESRDEINEEEFEDQILKEVANDDELEYDESADDQEIVENTMDPFVERPVDPKAELIKAPKVKLDGLKVLGKIDLPQTAAELEEMVESKKSENQTEHNDSEGSDDTLASLDAAMESIVQDVKPSAKVNKVAPEEDNEEREEKDPFKDKYGNYRFTKEQRENRKNKMATINERKRIKALKEKKKKHYYEQVKQKPKEQKVTKKKQKASSVKKSNKQLPEKESPKGLWGKFIHWLND
jgi:hypothetical protein